MSEDRNYYVTEEILKILRDSNQSGSALYKVLDRAYKDTVKIKEGVTECQKAK